MLGTRCRCCRLIGASLLGKDPCKFFCPFSFFLFSHFAFHMPSLCFSYPFFFAHLFLSFSSRSLLYNSVIVINHHSNRVIGRHHKTFEAHNHFSFFFRFHLSMLKFSWSKHKYLSKRKVRGCNKQPLAFILPQYFDYFLPK